jgi:hypothetical protein
MTGLEWFAVAVLGAAAAGVGLGLLFSKERRKDSRSES